MSLGPRLSSFLLDTNEEDDLVLENARRLLPLLRSQVQQICAFVFHENLDAIKDNIPANMMLLEFGFQVKFIHI